VQAQGARVWALLGPGRGSFYVCGDAKRMAKDVHAALVEVAAAHGGGGGAQGTQGGAAQGEAALEAMATEGRYLKDVY
jgi:sulfite reductase (NADPH) flavoprotein alpha-component